MSNSSIKTNILPNSREKKIRKNIPHIKHSNTYPAVLIGRLGVSLKFRGLQVGCELMDFIKSWFIDPHNKTGCRFIVVDAYNEDAPLNYYQKNGFEFIFSSEEQEAEFTYDNKQKKLATRIMYFDLIRLFDE